MHVNLNTIKNFMQIHNYVAPRSAKSIKGEANHIIGLIKRSGITVGRMSRIMGAESDTFRLHARDIGYADFKGELGRRIFAWFSSPKNY